MARTTHYRVGCVLMALLGSFALTGCHTPAQNAGFLSPRPMRTSPRYRSTRPFRMPTKPGKAEKTDGTRPSEWPKKLRAKYA